MSDRTVTIPRHVIEHAQWLAYQREDLRDRRAQFFRAYDRDRAEHELSASKIPQSRSTIAASIRKLRGLAFGNGIPPRELFRLARQ